MNAVKTIVVAACVVAMSCTSMSCTSAPPARVHYLLRADAAPQSARVEAPIRVGISGVTIAPYLRQSGIVISTDDAKVRVAKQHHWAEPLDASLRSYLRDRVSESLGYEISMTNADRPGWDYAIDVYVDRLHGTMAGTAILDANYRIARAASHTGGKQVEEYRFSKSATLSRKGYEGLVDAETELAGQLAAAIADSLRGMIGW